MSEIDLAVDATPPRLPRRAYLSVDFERAGWGNREQARAWARAGRVRATKAPNGRTWLFDADDVDRIWGER